MLCRGLQAHSGLCLSEIMTILIGFHHSCNRNFETDYIQKVQQDWLPYFPRLQLTAMCFLHSSRNHSQAKTVDVQTYPELKSH